LPEATEAVLAGMVEDFKGRHRTGHVDPKPLVNLEKVCKWLAGIYCRYSCDNSSPTSIIDQMAKGLSKARDEGRYIPWAYVFCDYSVSGLNSSRRGYSSYKAVLQDEQQLIETTYIDDFSRASRDEIEWWKLGALSKRLGKRMIGASDGFNLSDPNWDVWITVYGLLSRLFIKQLRQKVLRGQLGAARRGTCLGKPPLGFTRCELLDDAGKVVVGTDGHPVYRFCIDPSTRDVRKLLYELFVEKSWSTYRIAQHFNSLKVDGWGGWNEGGIKKLLWSATAVGVYIWNKTRRDYDYQENKWVKVKNPRKEWAVRFDPELAIVPLPLWVAARKKLSAIRRGSPLTGRKPSRNQKSATTLFSGTLFCGDCGTELLLMRSAGNYKVIGCRNGPTGKHNCTLSTTKSTRIIESCLLDFLRDNLMTDSAVEALVAKANAFLAAEAAKPSINTAPLKAAIRKAEAAITKLFGRIEGSQNEALVQATENRIAQLQKEVNDLKGQLREADAHNEPPPAPLNSAAVKALLSDVRRLLNQEIPAAAEAIRALTGPITIRQEKVAGRNRGAKWIASFSPDLLGWLRQRAKATDCPDSVTLEYLSSRIWTKPETVEVPIEHTPKYERIAPKVAELAARGASISAIAAAKCETWETIKQSLDFIKTGRRPKWRPSGTNTGKGHARRKQIVAAEVVRLRDEEGLTFTKIARRFDVCSGTVVRAYDRERPEAVRDAAERGRRPVRGRYSRLKPDAKDKIAAGFKVGQRREEIARNAGCSVSTVYRIRDQMRSKLKNNAGSDERGAGPDEWSLCDLAAKLRIPEPTLDRWRRNDWVIGRQIAGPRTRWLVWADADELDRLCRLHKCASGPRPYPRDLTTPKRPTSRRTQ
jgi:DNA invertase Pin-like site-specific DNA recombinase